MVLFSIVLSFFCVLIFYCFNKRITVFPKSRMVYRRGVGGGGKRRGLGPRNDVLTTCKAVNPWASQRPSKAAVCFLMISSLVLSFE